jgi:hypothetical protein
MISCYSFSSVNAQLQLPYFHDNFEDGDAEDGVPVKWIPAPSTFPGTRQVVNQNYVMTPLTDDGLASAPEGLIFGDVSVRTQFRSAGANWVGINARSSYNDNFEGKSYWGTITSTGELRIGYAINNDSSPLGFTQTGWHTKDQEIYLQADIIGTTLSLTAWLEGMEKPESPQLSADVSFVPDLENGSIAVWTFPDPDDIQPVAFRFIQAVPEPATLTLFGVALLGFLGYSRSRRMN